MNNKVFFKILIAFLFSAFVMTSCTSENEEELFPVSNITVSLKDDVQPIMNQSCAVSGCHVAGAQSPNLSSTSGTFAQKDRVNARAILAQTMPPSGALSQADSDVIKTWISEGGTDN